MTYLMNMFLTSIIGVVLCAVAPTSAAENQTIYCPPLEMARYNDPQYSKLEHYRQYSKNFSHICVTVGHRKHKLAHMEYEYDFSQARSECANAVPDLIPGFLLGKTDAIWLLNYTDLTGNRTNVSYWINDWDMRSTGQCAMLHVDESGNITINAISCTTRLDYFLCYTFAYNAPCMPADNAYGCVYNGANPHINNTEYLCYIYRCINGTLPRPPDEYEFATPIAATSTESLRSTKSVASIHVTSQWIGLFLLVALYAL